MGDIVQLLIDKGAKPIRMSHEPNAFASALLNANVNFPIYQVLIRAAKDDTYTLLKEAVFCRRRGDSPYKSLDALIPALEEVNNPSDIATLSYPSLGCQSLNEL